MNLSRALLGLAAAAFVLADLANPQFSPLSEPVSRYVNGTAGWLTTVAILAMAAGSALLLPRVRGAGRRLLLAVWVGGLVVAGVFPADPPGQWAHPSTSEMVHGTAAMIALAVFPVAAVLLSADRLHRGLAAASVVTTTAFFVLLIDVMGDGPSLTVAGTSLLGLAERLAVAAALAWMTLVTRPAPDRENRMIRERAAG